MSFFRLVEGIISIKRPPKTLGNYSAEGDYAAGSQTFDFVKVRKDVYFETNKPISFKLSATGDSTSVGAGTWRLTDEWTSQLIVTFTATSTHFIVYANG